MSDTLHHYIIVRKDIPRPGPMSAQIIHATGESIVRPIAGRETHAYSLEIDGERELLELSERLRAGGVPHIVIREPDEPYNGQATAIGCVPTEDRERVRRYTSHLRLVR